MSQSQRTFAAIAGNRVQVPSAVIVRQVADEAVILNLETEHYFGLDPVGRRVLEVLAESPDVHSGVVALLREFKVDQATLQQDVVELLIDLEQQGLVSLTGVDTLQASAQS